MDRWLLLGMLAGCGRFGFDASPSRDAGGSDAAASAYAAAVLADRPIGYWRFGDPTRIVDEIGGPDGTAIGGCTAADGNLARDPDGAIAFDGSCYVDLGPGFPFAGTAPFTVEVWIRSDGNLIYEHIVSHQLRDQTDPLDGYALLDSPSGVYFERVVSSINEGTTASAIPPSVSLHVAGVYDSMRSRLYLDGVEAGVSNVDATPAPAVAARLEVGAARRATGEHQSHFEGVIDEVAIYDYALTPAQLFLHWQIGSAGP